jgi:hypothetical protein
VVKHKPRWKAIALGLLSITRNAPTEGGIDLVICDGFGDAFWPERWAEEEKSGRKVNKTGIRGDEVGLKDILDAIGRLRREFGAVVVISTQYLGVSLLTSNPKVANAYRSVTNECDTQSSTPPATLSVSFRPRTSYLESPYPGLADQPNRQDSTPSASSRNDPCRRPADT